MNPKQQEQQQEEEEQQQQQQQLKLFTRAQVKSSSTDRAFIIVGKVVLDVTDFISSNGHPGGADILAQFIGLDATGAFEAMGHSMKAKQKALEFVVGKLVD
jgi:cytochrome b involved in lipid metabolism